MLKHGLEFCVFPSKIDRKCTLFKFELLYVQLLKYTTISTDALMPFNAWLINLAHIYCGSNIDKFNFCLYCENLNALKSLCNNNIIIISKPDKKVGVVILDKDYNKMVDILKDTTKF